MSDKNEEFWKELMGDDFKVNLAAGKSSAPDPKPAPPEPKPAQPPLKDGDLGFTIEYVNKEGQAVDTPAPQPAPQPRPAQPQPRPTQPQPRPAQPSQQRPAQPQPRPAQQPPQRPAQPQPRPAAPQQPPQRPAAPQQRPVQQPPQRPVQQPPRDWDTPTRAPVHHISSEPVERYRVPDEVDEFDPPPAYLKKRGKKDPADKFEVEFDFDSEYPDVNEKAIRRGRSRRTGCLSGILMVIFVVCVSVVLASLGWMWATDMLGFDGQDATVEVTLPKDIFHEEEREDEDEDGKPITVTVSAADLDAVAEELYQKGLIQYKWLFKLFGQLSHADVKVQAGTYTLNYNFDYRAIVHGLSPKTGSRATVDLMVPEGYTINQIVGLMVENGVCGADELRDALANYDFDYEFLKGEDVPPLGDPKRLEGFLFPDTYQFYVDDDPVNVVKRFLNNFQKKWTDDFTAQAAEMGYSVRDILNVAAMIEREAGNDQERDLIASVIYNRLDHPDRQGTNGLLQINATILYVTEESGQPYSTDLDSPYNTYMYPGLPAGPIANPGLASIRAALNPQSTDYYYYALGQNKSHEFFKTYDQFTKFVNSDEYGG